MRRPAAEPAPVSRPVRRFMAWWFGHYLNRHLDALCLPVWSVPPPTGHPGPIVVFCNHPSWWDAIIVVILAERLFPEREAHAPFDAAMLEKYPVFRRIGAFGVELGSRRGAARFLAEAGAILAAPHRMIWITAQGRFADVRARPLGLQSGIARLSEIAPDALFVPLALEYAFWTERGVAAFAAFGPGVSGAELAALPRPERLRRLEADLTVILDRLNEDVIGREPARFRALLSGRKGVGGVYDLWRRLAAWRRGRPFDPAHRSTGGSAE